MRVGTIFRLVGPGQVRRKAHQGYTKDGKRGERDSRVTAGRWGYMAEEHKDLAQATWVISGATLLSRILGYLRDMVIAVLFGASLSADAFFVAFRIPSLLRRLLGEGTLSAAIVPVLVETTQRDGEERSRELAGKPIGVLTVVLASVWPRPLRGCWRPGSPRLTTGSNSHLSCCDGCFHMSCVSAWPRS
jgi:hypothetical protein